MQNVYRRIAAPDFLQKPIEYACRFLLTFWAFVKADKTLLIRNPRYLAPSVYCVSAITMAIASLKTFWPDDPVANFENPEAISLFKPIFSILPLPIFCCAALYLMLINVPMYLISTILGKNPRIDRIYSASSYVFFNSLLVVVFYFIFCIGVSSFLVSYGFTKFPPYEYFKVGFIPILIFFAYNNNILLSRAHNMRCISFFLYNVAVSIIPVIILQTWTPAEGVLSTWNNLFNPRPIRLFTVPSESMLPNIPVGSELIVNQLLPVTQMHVGDVIVFRLPRDGVTPYIKRIIARGGDKIQMKNGRVVVNGEMLQRISTTPCQMEDFYGNENSVPCYIERNRGRKYRIAEIQGDNGFNDNTEVFNVPPKTLFVMGDNRDNSTDSRVPPDQGGVGYVPYANVIGKVYFFSYPRNLGYLYKSVPEDSLND